jgi:hypothetical protein
VDVEKAAWSGDITYRALVMTDIERGELVFPSYWGVTSDEKEDLNPGVPKLRDNVHYRRESITGT